MSERARSTYPTVSCLRSQSCRDSRDRVTRTASELHRQTVDRAHRRFEQQLENSERELRWAISQRRNHSSSPSEKRHATQHLQQLRATLNHDYSQLIQAYVQDHKDKVTGIERCLNKHYEDDHRNENQRKYLEAVENSQFEYEKNRPGSINQIIREQDNICEEKLAAQKRFYDRILDEQAQRLRAEQSFSPNTSSIPDEQIDIAKLKGRLARVEYEHQELKRLVFNLRTDLTTVLTQPPIYRSIINIPNFGC